MAKKKIKNFPEKKTASEDECESGQSSKKKKKKWRIDLGSFISIFRTRGAVEGVVGRNKKVNE